MTIARLIEILKLLPDEEMEVEIEIPLKEQPDVGFEGSEIFKIASQISIDFAEEKIRLKGYDISWD